MAISKAKKHEKVAQLTAELQTSTSAIVGTFSGLTAAKDYALRQTIRAAGGKYRVVKNKLAPLASSGTQIEAALAGLKGVSSVAYTSGDPVALAKALSGWVKDNTEFFSFKLGIVDGRVITVQEIQNLATLPSKEELFSKLLYLIQSPAQRLATVINATGRNLAVVVNMAAEQGKFGAPDVAAPEAETPSAPVAAEPGAVEPVAAEPASAEPVAAEPVASEAPAAEVAEAPVVEAAPSVEEIVEAKAEEAPAADTEGASAQAEAAATEAPTEG